MNKRWWLIGIGVALAGVGLYVAAESAKETQTRAGEASVAFRAEQERTNAELDVTNDKLEEDIERDGRQMGEEYGPAARWIVSEQKDELRGKVESLSLDGGALVVHCLPVFAGELKPPFRMAASQADGEEVRYRIDNGKIQLATLAVSGDASALIVPEAMLKVFAQSKKAVLEYEPVGQQEVLDLTGLGQAEREAGCPQAPQVAKAKPRMTDDGRVISDFNLR